MAIIQLTWVDASTNESKFNIYRGKDGVSQIDLADSSTYDVVATLEYNASATGADWANSKWENTLTSSVADDSGDFQLTSGFGNLSTDSGSTFVATYTDSSTPATGYHWGVTAENAIGESTVTQTGNLLDIN